MNCDLVILYIHMSNNVEEGVSTRSYHSALCRARGMQTFCHFSFSHQIHQSNNPRPVPPESGFLGGHQQNACY